MIKIDDSDIKKYERDLKTFARRAYPFATKQTVNAAAWQGRQDVQSHLGRDMVLRNKWTQQSIRVEQTRTLHVRKQMALMGSIEPYMERQEFGGTVTKKGQEGVPIPTSYAAGQPMSQKPRTKLPTKRHRMENIKLRQRAGGRSLSRKQRNLVAMKQAARSKSKLVFLDLGETKGIFRVLGPPKRPRVKMVYDLSRSETRTPRNPWLAPSVARTIPKIPQIYLDALKFQIERQQIFK